MDTRTRTRLATTVAVVLVLPPSVGALAHDHVAPRAALRVGQARQRGVLVHEHWTTSSGSECVTRETLFERRFPQPIDAEPGDAPVIVFRTATPPDDVHVIAWTRRHLRSGAPGATVPFLLRPRSGDRLSWGATLLLERLPAHLFLEARAAWIDREACLERQEATWTFRLRRARP